MVGGKNCLCFVFGTVDWRSDNRFSVVHRKASFQSEQTSDVFSHLLSSWDSSGQLQDFARLLCLELLPLDWV